MDSAKSIAAGATPAMDSTYTLELTPEQQYGYARLVGTRKAPLTLPRRRLAALALAAAAASRDVLPLSQSPALIQCILHPDSLPDDVAKPFVVCVPLTPEQSAEIHALTGTHMRYVAIAPEEWPVSYAENWEAGPPLRISRTITVATAGGAAPASGDHLVVLPAQAEGVFGNGRHPATRAALLLIEDHLQPGQRVFDIGTGSGILAIAAARLGAKRILAVDVEPAAVALAREAVALNRLEQDVQVELGSIEIAMARYDMVIMNIFPDVVVTLAPELHRVLQREGYLVTSGTVAARAGRLSKSMARLGYEVIDERRYDNWVAQLYRGLDPE